MLQVIRLENPKRLERYSTVLYCMDIRTETLRKQRTRPTPWPASRLTDIGSCRGVVPPKGGCFALTIRRDFMVAARYVAPTGPLLSAARHEPSAISVTEATSSSDLIQGF
jgi:hypothetical protein